MADIPRQQRVPVHDVNPRLGVRGHVALDVPAEALRQGERLLLRLGVAVHGAVEPIVVRVDQRHHVGLGQVRAEHLPLLLEEDGRRQSVLAHVLGVVPEVGVVLALGRVVAVALRLHEAGLHGAADDALEERRLDEQVRVRDGRSVLDAPLELCQHLERAVTPGAVVAGEERAGLLLVEVVLDVAVEDSRLVRVPPPARLAQLARRGAAGVLLPECRGRLPVAEVVESKGGDFGCAHDGATVGELDVAEAGVVIH